MIRLNVILRALFVLVAVCAGVPSTVAQDVGGDAGGGAGIFRPKNPETKKRTTKPGTTTTGGGRTTGRRAVNVVLNDRAEDSLEKANGLRDARKFSEAEAAYQEVARLKPRDARAAYGLGNVYADQ